MDTKRYKIMTSISVPSKRGMVHCLILRDYKEHIMAAKDKYWKRPVGRR